jgi:hypothetical protein
MRVKPINRQILSCFFKKLNSLAVYFLTGSGRSADAMDVLFEDIRQLKVDDSFDAGNVKAASGDICRQQDVDLLLFESSTKISVLIQNIFTLKANKEEVNNL